MKMSVLADSYRLVETFEQKGTNWSSFRQAANDRYCKSLKNICKQMIFYYHGCTD
jgi:hypothetical protein